MGCMFLQVWLLQLGPHVHEGGMQGVGGHLGSQICLQL